MSEMIERVAMAIHAASNRALPDADGVSPPWDETTEKCRECARELARVAVGAMGVRVQPQSPHCREDDHSWIDISKKEPPISGMRVDLHLIVDPHCFETTTRYEYWYPGQYSGKDGKNRLTHWRHITSAPLDELHVHLEKMRQQPKTIFERFAGRRA
jgi:hypothetical protein